MNDELIWMEGDFTLSTTHMIFLSLLKSFHQICVRSLSETASGATKSFSLKTWRKAEKRSTEIEKPGTLPACLVSPGCLRLFRLCHLLISSRENRDVDFDTFFETTHHFLSFTRLWPPTIREKLSKMCCLTTGFETAQQKSRNLHLPIHRAPFCLLDGKSNMTPLTEFPC